MSKTHKEILDFGTSASDMAVAAANLRDTNDNGIGTMIAEVFTPAWKVRTGLSASATHIDGATTANPDGLPGSILLVLNEAGTTPLVITSAGAPGAGQVKVTYDSAGIPTLVFGDGANTGYQVLKFEAPIGLAAKLAALFR